MVGDDVTVKELLMENREDTKILLSDVSTIKEHLRTLNGRVAKAESRIDSLRVWKWKQAGAIVILSILATYIFNKII